MQVPSKQPTIYGVVSVFTILSAFLVPLRIWARSLSAVGIWWDDWVLLVAWVCKLSESDLRGSDEVSSASLWSTARPRLRVRYI